MQRLADLLEAEIIADWFTFVELLDHKSYLSRTAHESILRTQLSTNNRIMSPFFFIA